MDNSPADLQDGEMDDPTADLQDGESPAVDQPSQDPRVAGTHEPEEVHDNGEKKEAEETNIESTEVV